MAEEKILEGTEENKTEEMTEKIPESSEYKAEETAAQDEYREPDKNWGGPDETAQNDLYERLYSDAESGQQAENPQPGPGPAAGAEQAYAYAGRRRTNRLFDLFSGEAKFAREQAVLSRIDDAHLMDYLALEQKRYESQQKQKDERGKRFLSAFQLAASLAAIVAVIGFLKDEPTVLVNILYIIGIIAAIWLWKTKK